MWFDIFKHFILVHLFLLSVVVLARVFGERYLCSGIFVCILTTTKNNNMINIIYSIGPRKKRHRALLGPVLAYACACCPKIYSAFFSMIIMLTFWGTQNYQVAWHFGTWKQNKNLQFSFWNVSVSACSKSPMSPCTRVPATTLHVYLTTSTVPK